MNSLKLDNTKEYKSISDNIKPDNTREDDANGDNGLSPHSTRTNTKGNNFNEGEETNASLEVGVDSRLSEALSILDDDLHYPFDEESATALLTEEMAKHPYVDPVDAVLLATDRISNLPDPDDPFIEYRDYITESFCELSTWQKGESR